MCEAQPYVIECLGVILSAWFSYSIAHFGPKVEPQLAWAITVTLASLYQPNIRYLASSVAAAVLTRMTKIATGHPSATAGAMSALLITLLVLAILNTKGEWVYDVTHDPYR